jgi:hypothetical protein
MFEFKEVCEYEKEMEIGPWFCPMGPERAA